MSENQNPTELDAIIAEQPTMRTADQAPGEPAPPIPAPAPRPDPAITLGRIVHFREFADVDCQCPVVRPALVIAVWGPECCNLLVYGPDGDTVVHKSVMKESERDSVKTKRWFYPARAEG